MNTNYLSIVEAGLAGELRELSLAEVLRHLRNHLRAFHPDPDVCAGYLGRMLPDPGLASDPLAADAAAALLETALELTPFAPNLVAAAARLTRDPGLIRRHELLTAAGAGEETYRLIEGLDMVREGDEALRFLEELLLHRPDNLAAAQRALRIDRMSGRPPGTWLARFRCPEPATSLWRTALFDHHAALLRVEAALELFEGLDQTALGAASLNLAAEVFAAAGERRQAAGLYRRSLALRAGQTPAALRLAELENPLRIDPALPLKKRVMLCLYTCNKAESLKRTLENLAASRIGRSGLRVLLNGCRDDSRTVAAKARELFPDNDLELVELPVNVGAPAARNWLLSLPEVAACDYVAFLDDDVDVPAHWLEAFLTVAESDPKTAVVGAKVVFPGKPALLQYLFRHVGLAGHGLLKMSLHAPVFQYDNAAYDFVRETRSVMGCLHLLRTAALTDAPEFDIRFSPSQVDDIDHDLLLCLAGHRTRYCGLATCVHHQSSGVSQKSAWTPDRVGNCLGNDLKFFYKHSERLDRLAALDDLGIDLGPPGDFGGTPS